MNRLKQKLKKFKKLGVIHSFKLEEQIPSWPGDTESRLIDRLTIYFNGGEDLILETFCSGCMENTSLELVNEE